METQIKYVIQDTDTGLWLTITPQPSLHSSKWGWDKPFPKAEDYWINDLSKALCFFKDRQDAEDYLKDRLDEKYSEFMKHG